MSFRFPVLGARLCVSFAVATLACMTVLALGAGSALAVRGHVSSGEFGEPCTVEPCALGKLKEPDGVAVNEATGMLYVAEKGADRVQVFDTAKKEAVGQFNGSGSEGEGKPAGGGTEPDEEATGEFKEPTQIAVDNSCEQHKPKLNETTTPKCSEYDKSYGDVYVLDSGHKVVDKYTAAGKYIGQVTAQTLGVTLPDRQFRGVAVEADGDLLVSVYAPATDEGPLLERQEGVYRLSDAERNVLLPSPGDPTGLTSTLARGGFVEPGLAAAGERVFVDQTFGGSVTAWGLEGALLAGGVVNEKVVPPVYTGSFGGLGAEACTGDVYVDTGLAVERLEGTGDLVESLPVPNGAAPVAQGVGYGVSPDCRSLTVFAANANADAIDVFGPEPPNVPLVEPGSGFSAEVTSDGAKLSAVVNPRSELGELATTYRFEYGPCPAEGSCENEGYPQSSEGSLPASYEPSGVSLTLRGLVAGTRYHYRLSARNGFDPESSELPPVYGEELTFTTQPAFPGGLLDGRGWELVTPPDKHGAEIEPFKENGVIQAAANGSAIAYLASALTEAGPAGNTNKTQVLSRRGEAGWASCDISSPNAQATGVSIGKGDEYRAFADNLETALAWPFGVLVPGLVPGEREVSPLLVDLTGGCGVLPSYRALLSGCPESGECERAVEEHADLEPGIEVAPEEHLCREGEKEFCAAQPLGSNPSLSAVVVQSVSPLVHGLPREALYEWDGGHVYPVSVLANGTVVGEQAHLPVLGGAAGAHNVNGYSLRGAVSEDGSRVVWSENAGGKHLYVWDREAGRSVQVDTVQEGASGGGVVRPIFQFATSDGSKVFFTDEQALTQGSGADAQHADLYECEVIVEGEGEEAKPKCVLRDLTPKTEAGESAGVLGEAIGYSNDASTVYFVADGVLSTHTNPSGQSAVKGTCQQVPTPSTQCNLYEWHDGATALVAVISGEDVGDWGGEGGVLTDLVGRVTGNGEWLAFMSNRSLTGYDNRDIHSGARDEEVYLYNSTSKNLVCVSCNPTGERPNGVSFAQFDSHLAGGVRVWPPGGSFAANVPGWVPFELGFAQYQPRYLDETGRMFFNSSDGLVPRDTNGTEDVYEYEPAGVGSCRVGGPGYVVAEGGCLGLVSSGESSEESAFLDASESGDDVFFLTKAQLSKRDTDTALDIYDARVGGIEPPESKPVECLGDACQSPVTPPESLTPSSLTAGGPGNVLTPSPPGSTTKTVVKGKPLTRAQKLAQAMRACAKKPRGRKRSECVKQARKKYGARAKTKHRAAAKGRK